MSLSLSLDLNRVRSLLVMELEVKHVFLGQSFFSDDCLHCNDVLANGVSSVELVGDVRVVFSCHPFADRRLHQTRQGRKDVDGRVDLSVMELSIEIDLALRDVPRCVFRAQNLSILLRQGEPSSLAERRAYPVRSGMGCVMSSLGIVRIGS
mmetsp:Transcript_14434/g.58454  ORF Transcript_14434/g.58454 Transcript_14434/m.58454 type:complete len:151 (-) Transcript_14434:1107-1559(-)